MRTLQVDLGDRSYPIYIGQNLLSDPQWLRPFVKGSQVCVVTNETIAPLYLDRVLALLDGLQVSTLILPDGEAHKTLDVLSTIYDRLLEDRHNRSTTLIALGGGVVGDMTGYAAASYQRGVDFIQIPTTLLSQVDSSVGGKTGVNHPLGKNMIGAFHQPNVVVIDSTVLSTLPPRELSAGIAEVIKYGLIADVGFYEWLEQNIERLMVCDTDALEEAIERSCQNKADVVAQDEREGGVRAILNLGHTFGHALESAVAYETIRLIHGKGVSIGMMLAHEFSQQLGLIDQPVVDRVLEHLKEVGLPIQMSDIPGQLPPASTLLDIIAQDKKVSRGQLTFILSRGIGDTFVEKGVDPKTVQAFLEEKLKQ